MSHKKRKHACDDRSYVNIYETCELDYWTVKWGVTRDRIRRAVGKVGIKPVQVAKYLGRRA